jgi:hypothetical protein
MCNRRLGKIIAVPTKKCGVRISENTELIYGIGHRVKCGWGGLCSEYFGHVVSKITDLLG